MQEFGTRQVQPELKELVAEASRALSRLDGRRLEELAISCQALNRNLEPSDTKGRRELHQQAREAAGDMAVFARVLEATRSNLKVMNRLRELRMGRLEYSEESAAADWGWAGMESTHGND